MRVQTFAIATLLAATGCDYSGDWLFDGAVEGVPGVVHLNDELGEFTPATVEGPAQVDQAVIYGEVGPTGTTEAGGATISFEGTGGHVCLWVDPELVFWNQSVSAARPNPTYSYPDNVFDDGDLDLYAGFSAYYNGTPGEQMGDFDIRYEDSLGNPIEIGLNECTISSLTASTGGHSGRGAPEYCTLRNTQPGVTYMVALEAWSTPLDDSRLGYGLLVVDGTCGELQEAANVAHNECLILGEAVDGSANDAPGPWVGADNVPSRAGSVDFEQAFCRGGSNLTDFCATEAEQNDCSDPEARCYCGDPENTPSPGSF